MLQKKIQRVYIKLFRKDAFMEKISSLIVAAGKGTRMRSSTKKQFLDLGGFPILFYSVGVFEKCNIIDQIVLVVNENDIDYCRNLVRQYNFRKVYKIISGGEIRQESVYNGLKALNGVSDIVLIHDGVRPFITEDIIIKSVENAKLYGSCVVGVPVKDTVKICDTDNFISSTPDRKLLWAVQTPQTFKYEIIMKAYESAISDNFIATDDSMIAERLGYKVKMINGDYKNIKITTPEDMLIANAFLSSCSADCS